VEKSHDAMHVYCINTIVKAENYFDQYIVYYDYELGWFERLGSIWNHRRWDMEVVSIVIDSIRSTPSERGK